MGYITSSLYALLGRPVPPPPPVTGGGDGADGADGASAYCYIAYASDGSGTGFTTTFDAGLDYIAVLSTDTEILSPSAGDFAGLWKNYKGAAGATGAPGTGSPGATGADGNFVNQYQGAYVGGSSYVIGDIVTYGGGSYVCTADDPSSSVDPAAGTANWDVIAEKGATGAAGSSGGVSGSETKTGSTYTLDAAEANKHVLLTNSSGCAVTVGANASTDFDVWVFLHRGTSGQVTLSASGGATIVGPTSTGAPGDAIQLVQASASVYHTLLHPGGNINTLTTDSSPDLAADYVRTWDNSAGVEKKVLLNLIGGGGDCVLLDSATASSSAALTFDGVFTSSYDAYRIDLIDIAPATDSVTLLFRWRDAGSDVTGTAHYTGFNYTTPILASSQGTLYVNSTSGHPCPHTDLGNAAGETTTLTVWALPRSTVRKAITFSGYYYNYLGSMIGVPGGMSTLANTTAMSGFKLLYNSGNIASGKVRVYGYKNS